MSTLHELELEAKKARAYLLSSIADSMINNYSKWYFYNSTDIYGGQHRFWVYTATGKGENTKLCFEIDEKNTKILKSQKLEGKYGDVIYNLNSSELATLSAAFRIGNSKGAMFNLLNKNEQELIK